MCNNASMYTYVCNSPINVVVYVNNAIVKLRTDRQSGNSYIH